MKKYNYIAIGFFAVSLFAFGKNFSDNTIRLGTGGAATDTEIISNQPGTSDPKLKFSQSIGKWVFSNDGVAEKTLGSGSGGGGGENFNNAFGEDDNGNAEDGLTGWTASAGTFATNNTDPLEGEQSFEWTPAAQNDTLESPVLDLDKDIFKGRACEARIEYIGGDDNLTLKVVDADSDVIAEQELFAHSISGVESVFFLCPSSGATANDLDLKIVIENTGASASPLIKFDKSYLGTLIGLESSAEVGTPGQIITTTQDVCPQGTLYADGSAVSRTLYSDLYAAVGDRHGNGDGSTTFNLPDYRGRFLRGHADGNGRDPDRGSRASMNPGGASGDNIGSVQTDTFGAHDHRTQMSGSGNNNSLWHPNPNLSTNNRAYATALLNDTSFGYFDTHMEIVGGSETRPENAYVKFCIRYATVQQQIYKSVPKVSNNINEFSASIVSPTTIFSQNVPWIDSVTNGGAGQYIVNFIAGTFTEAPHCMATVKENGGGATDNIITFGTSASNVQVQIAEVVNGVLNNENFTLFCQKKGSDFKMPVVQPVVIAGVPTGSMMPYAGSTAPVGFLLADGSAVSRTEYAALFAAIGTAYGNGDGSTTFNLPDTRGKFIRGVANGSAADPDRASRTACASGGNVGDNVGSCQGDAVPNLVASGSRYGPVTGGPFTATLNGDGTYAASGAGRQGYNVTFNASFASPAYQNTTEVRPENVYANYIIKY